jgi:hypothetical protein
MDQEILVRLMQKSYLVFTTDLFASKAIGRLLWHGRDATAHANITGDDRRAGVSLGRSAG